MGSLELTASAPHVLVLHTGLATAPTGHDHDESASNASVKKDDDDGLKFVSEDDYDCGPRARQQMWPSARCVPNSLLKNCSKIFCPETLLQK